ncbi:MAG: hypothetical protein RL326_477, partial [Pseudomonadota bacterium]
MDWQTMIAFCFCFWGTYHLLNVVKDWRKNQELTRLLRDLDKQSICGGVLNSDRVTRV